MQRLGRLGLIAGLAVVLALLPAPVTPLSLAPGPPEAEPLQPYRVTEFPIYRGPGIQTEPALRGNWVVWRDYGPNPVAGSLSLRLRHLATGAELGIATSGSVSQASLADGLLVTMEQGSSYQRAILAYSLPEGEPFTIVPSHDVLRGSPTSLVAAAEGFALLAEGQSPVARYRLYDLVGRTDVPVPDDLFEKSGILARFGVARPWLVWRDRRRAPPGPASVDGDVYAYHLVTGEIRRLSTTVEPVSDPSISGTTVVWTTVRQGRRALVAHDLATGEERLLASYPAGPSQAFGPAPDIDGDIVVWNAMGCCDHDILGYDLKRDRSFVVSRAVGDQTAPRVLGRRVVWADARHGNIQKYGYDSDVYGALLEEGPAPPPPAWGVPQAVDLRLEAVWPEGRTAALGERAVVDTWVFQSGTRDFAACMWNPKLQLWKAVNAEPARLVGEAGRNGNYAVPTWSFHRIDVSEARDPSQKIYFFVGLPGLPASSNVWAHAVEEARTYQPVPNRPTGTAPAGGAVDARIEIVWPHGNAPVEKAERVNLTAMLLQPGTLVSVPPDWSPTVRLLRSLNDGVAREAALGSKRIVQDGELAYPVWDFNDLGVLEAQDPANTYYFRLSVDGVTTYSNVWTHGQDGRTFFPQRDTPAGPCQR